MKKNVYKFLLLVIGWGMAGGLLAVDFVPYSRVLEKGSPVIGGKCYDGIIKLTWIGNSVHIYKENVADSIDIACRGLKVGTEQSTKAVFEVNNKTEEKFHIAIYGKEMSNPIKITFRHSKETLSPPSEEKLPEQYGPFENLQPPTNQRAAQNKPVDNLVAAKKVTELKAEIKRKNFEGQINELVRKKEKATTPEEISGIAKLGKGWLSEINGYLNKVRNLKGTRGLDANLKQQLQAEEKALEDYFNTLSKMLTQWGKENLTRDKNTKDEIKIDKIDEKYKENVASKLTFDDYDDLIVKAETALTKSEQLIWFYLQKDGIAKKIANANKVVSEAYSSFEQVNEQFLDTIRSIYPAISEENIEDITNYLSEQRGALANNLDVKQRKLDDLNMQIQAVKVPYAAIILVSITIFILLFGLYFYTKAYKKNRNKEKQTQLVREQELEVSQKSMSIRKEINKTQVGININVDKHEYFIINASTMFADSMVQKIYFKKGCLEELYRFFSDTLKDPERTKEAGCYLIGRWEIAMNDNSDVNYNVTYEAIVTPGDDAVYSEYELNFGAKIGMKMSRTIANLREKTNSQYVLTSWVHSHPGLGIFLSNHDIIVQKQLTGKEHANRLTAMVVDVLTPNMDFAIFTAKKSGEMNNSNDLKKVLSLEEIYRQSKNPNLMAMQNENENEHEHENKPAAEKKTINANININEYYDILPKDLVADSQAIRILLNKRSIIEVEEKAARQQEGITGYFMGFSAKINDESRETIAINGIIVPGDLHAYSPEEIKGVLYTCENFDAVSLHAIKNNSLKASFIVVYEERTENAICIPLSASGTYMTTDTYPLPYFEWLKWTRRKL